jgi:aminoglycoside phosphotransferase (APT) family kinase protein
MLPMTALCENQVKRIFAGALPGHPIESFAPLIGGLSNLMYRVDVVGLHDSFVLRVFRRDPAACQKEVDLHRLVSAQVPVPEILYADPRGDEDIGPYLVSRWVKGETFREIKSRRDPGEIAEGAYSIGAVLARIGSFSFPQPGWIGAGLEIAAPLAAGPDPVPSFIEQCAADPEFGRRVGAAQRRQLCDFISRAAPQLKPLNGANSLVHSDFGSRNLILHRTGERWTVAAVLDWEFAFSGSPLTDLGHFLRYERQSQPRLEPHFSTGFWDAGGALPDQWRELARALDLSALCDCLTRPDLPAGVVPELVELVAATIEKRDRDSFDRPATTPEG